MYQRARRQINQVHPHKIWDSIIAKDTSLLTQFLLITFADLKKYQYFYWFAFPAFVSKPAWEISENGWQPAQDEIKGVCFPSMHISCSHIHFSWNPSMTLFRAQFDRSFLSRR